MSVRGVHAGTVAGPRTTAPPPPQRGTRLHEFQRLVSRKEPWREHSACRGKDPKHWHPKHGFMVRELKVRNVFQPGQRDTLDQLTAAGVDADVWTPKDLDSGRIVAELRGREHGA